MYCVIDIETSIYESFGRTANPFDSRNYIVAAGMLYQDGRLCCTHKLRDMDILPDGWLSGVTCLVGQNIKFDLLYLWGRKDIQAFLARGGRIYDTMYVEYLLSGQHQRFENGAADGLDLNTLAAKYGGSPKPDKIKTYWQAGVQTIDIPQQELLDYLESDIRNTEVVFAGQVNEYKKLGMVNTIKAHNEGLLATIEMEYNGLSIDLDTAEVDNIALCSVIDGLKRDLDSFIPKDLPAGITWNWGSGAHVSALLFGGTIKYDVREQKTDPVTGEPLFTKKKGVVYQTITGDTVTEDEFSLLSADALAKIAIHTKGKKVGQYVTKAIEVPGEPKMHTIQAEYHIKGMTTARPEWKTKKDGVYKTDAKVKTILAAEGIPIAKLIHKLDKQTKLLGFYRYKDKSGVEKGMLTMIQADGRIHHKLNTTTTITGRLSSSDPNMQQCYDGDTEILTEKGFVKFSDYCSRSEIDRVCQYDMADGSVSWTWPKRLIAYNYTGDMIRYVSEHTDMYLTADHRCVVNVSEKGRGFLKARFLNHNRCHQYRHIYVSDAGDGLVIGERVSEYLDFRVDTVTDFPVYCVTVRGRAIIVRRNGKTYVCGNCPRSDTGSVRRMLVSRFGENGRVSEVDFSQLEVHGQAFLSGDENMKRDVTNKVDFHCMRVAAKLGEDYDSVKLKCKDENHQQHKEYKAIRTGAKSFSFQRAYGASVATIAADTGMPIEDVQALADSEDKLYPGVVEYNTANIESVTTSARTSGNSIQVLDDTTGKYLKCGVGVLVSPTGKRYTFVEQVSPQWMIDRQTKANETRAKKGFPLLDIKRTGIAPQQVKNYPVQGFCGELMLNVIGVLLREFIKRNRWDNKAYLINTVHDCVWLDCHVSVAKEVTLFVKSIMERAAEIMSNRYGIVVDVPFYAEAEMGLNFYDMQGVH